MDSHFSLLEYDRFVDRHLVETDDGMAILDGHLERLPVRQTPRLLHRMVHADSCFDGTGRRELFACLEFLGLRSGIGDNVQNRPAGRLRQVGPNAVRSVHGLEPLMKGTVE